MLAVKNMLAVNTCLLAFVAHSLDNFICTESDVGIRWSDRDSYSPYFPITSVYKYESGSLSELESG